MIGELYNHGAGRVAATFTNPLTTTTWSTTAASCWIPEDGRYYFAVRIELVDPNAIDATSTIAVLSPAQITKGTPLTANASSARVDAFAYTSGTDPWHQLDVRGNNTGGQAVAWLDPALAYGRLDSVSTSGGTLAAEVAPLFAHSYATAGGAIGASYSR